MGAENSILENCEWGDVIPTSSETDWSLQLASLKDESTVTVFRHKRKDKKEVDLLQRATKNLRTLRHPNLLRFIASGVNSDGSYLVTERVQPLENTLTSLHPFEICAGLHSVLEALLFLHDTVGVSHNNVCLSSVYVTTDGTWRLGGLEHSCKFQEADAEFLDKCLAFRNEETVSPEEKQGVVKATVEYGHARDVFAFGVLVEQLQEKLEDLGDLTKTFELLVQDECLNVDPEQRPTVQTLLNDRMFRHDFIDVLRFVKNVTTKSEEEKKKFFSNVTARLLSLPEELVAKRLAVTLLSRFVMLDETANKALLANLLTPYREKSRPPVRPNQPSPILCAQLFKDHVIPELFRIFHIRDSHIRLVLLTHFPAYVDLFEKETLEETIFPQLLIGLRDTNDSIVAASLRSLSYLVPILGGDVIIGGARKKFFSEGMPKMSEVKFGQHGRDEGKNTKLQNVTGILGKKMLLKDLAQLSSNGTVISGNEEKGAKRKEREKRREESRQRREERKKKQREQEAIENNKNAVSEEAQVVGDMDDVLIEEDRLENETIEVKVSQMNVKVTSDDQNGEEKSDWSDWERNQNDNENVDQSVSTLGEDELSDEIENELRNMPSTVSFSPKSSDSSSAFPSPKVDWSDAVSDNSKTDSRQGRTKGALKLGVQSKSKKSSDKVDDPVHVESSDWGQTWDNVDSVIEQTDNSTSRNIHSSTKQQPSTLKPVMKPTIPKPQSDLGAEFDIKGIKVQAPTAADVDFFSDMMPEISVTHKDLLSHFASQGKSENREAARESPKKESAKLSFAVVPDVSESVTEGDGGGWGDDLDWGAEDF
ncbi:protein-associating with the carboxyl-terminal domain of ezrin-like isoform X2 [Haliotis rubra]|uniref:protein-associating with the carboxyl-terminal domain of ezrin-like isoform X2 n=1 Tax=Haliotis rubra TaxID=36100 RepID=UPI001EE59921|nr:protein-associating with the carboxyl-terminal domain of ezrin-like isoform X2 [Haliotis rubra]